MIYAPSYAPSKATPETPHGCIHETGLERIRYVPRMLLGADDLSVEQQYFRTKLRRHNRIVHGWGWLCGGQAWAAPVKDHPWRIRVCPGYLLTPQGDEISIAREAFFDLATCIVKSEDPCAFSKPCPPIEYRYRDDIPRTVYLGVRYIECVARPIRIAPVGCGCDDDGCEYSRIADGYEFCCLDELPKTHHHPRVNCIQLCERRIIQCPECPEDPWVLVATIKLPGSATQQITDGAIDNLGNRKLLYSTEILQEMAQCFCTAFGAKAEQPAAVAETVEPSPPGISAGSAELTAGQAPVPPHERTGRRRPGGDEPRRAQK